jgi:glutamate-1-semialdehyde 2,1-aminomutase
MSNTPSRWEIALRKALAKTPVGRVHARLRLSLAKHPSLRGHSNMSRMAARLVPAYSYSEAEFFRTDGAPDAIAAERNAGFYRLAEQLRTRHARSLALSAEAKPLVSDMQFTSVYRVPPPFSALVQAQLKVASFVERSQGVRLIDLDGQALYDLTGSYGVNLLGYDAYKACLDQANQSAHALGPVLGSYHPILLSNVKRLCQISGQEEVSFHMSGTEAVMQAVRLARYHTGRTHLVRFCGAYHGFWGDVQPGVGNPVPAHETYTLKDMSEATLHVLRTRDDIACVLVNPLQALHPNRNAPSDSSLYDSSRSAGYDRVAYTRWLMQLRQVCSDRGIALIFDEVFVGFRLALGGAQEYFGVRADLVTYGKTLGGGLPVGVVCGAQRWMKRYDDDHPADICFARGTFNSHPYVMAAMDAFLTQLQAHSVYANNEDRWNDWAARFNARFATEGLPLRVQHLSSIWTLTYTQPGRYNWLLQYYLRAEGIALSWVGTGRIVWSLNYTDADVEAVLERFVAAAKRMQSDRFLWPNPALTNAAIQRQVAREVIGSYLAGAHRARRPRADPPSRPHAPAPAAHHEAPAAVLGGTA